MLTNTQLKEKLEDSPSPKRLTPERLDHIIKSCVFNRVTKTTTVCILEIKNGFEIIGKSSCVDPLNYNKDIAEKVAYDDAYKQLWPLEGYSLMQSIMKG